MIHHHPSIYSYRVPNIKATLMASAENQGNPGSSSGHFGCPGGAGNGSGTGFGMINASSMHGSSTHGYFSGYSTSEITSTSQWVSWDVAVPSNIQHLKIVANWIETAADSGASKARSANVRTYIDLPPFTAGGNSGEFSMSSAVNNVLSIASYRSATTGLCNRARGRTVRVKIYGASLPSGVRCKVGFTMLWHARNPTTPTPTLSVTSNTTIVKPAAMVTLTGTVSSPSTGDEVDNARIWPSSLNGFMVTQLWRRSADNILHSYTGSSHPSSPFPSLTGGMTIGQGLSRNVNFVLRAPISSVGNRTITLRATTDPGNRLLTASRTICVDGLVPARPASLRSTTHSPSVWSNNRNVRFAWTPGADNGCAGLVRQRYAIRQGSCPTPSLTLTTTTSARTMTGLAETTSSTGHYLAVRSEDRAGNIGASSCTGPYLIDVGRPSVTCQISNGSAYTRNLSVTVRNVGTDSRSGVTHMRHSGNGTTWSTWRTYTASHLYNLSSNGGGTAQGTKRVYCQIRDRAGNVSTAASDTIIYDSQPPVVTLCRVNSGATYTSSLAATLSVTATGSPHSMQYSNNGTTWSAWSNFTTNLSVNLAAFGGNSAAGTKSVHVRLRDFAGNVSNVCRDTITYLITPRITGSTISTLSNVTRGFYRLTGSGFQFVNRVDIGGKTITDKWTAANDDWWGTGAFRVRSDTMMDVYPPQAMPAGTYGVRFRNPLQASNVFNVKVTFETGRVLHTNSNLTAGKALTVNVARNGEPQTTPCIVTFSPHKIPSVVPGVISLEIGNNLSTLFQLPLLGFDSATRCLKLTLPTSASQAGLTLWFEAAYVRDPLPIPTTNASGLKLQ